MRGTRRICIGLAAVGIMLMTMPLFAQDGAAPTAPSGSGTGSVSWFQMFLVPGSGTPSGIDIIGTMVVWVLLILSAVNTGFMIHLGIKNRRITLIPFETYTQIEAMLNEKRYREAIDYTATDDSYLSKLVGAALNEAANGYSAMERAVEEVGDAETTKTLRPVEFLNVVGNIRAFQKLVELGGKPDPAALASGISTALVTTFWGLVVAIPALAGYALIRNRIDALTSEGLLMAEELIRPFKPGAKKTGSTGKPPSAAAQASGSAAPPPPGTKPGPGSPQPAAKR